VDHHIEEYIEQADWRVKENSNTVFSMGGMKNLLAETAIAKYALNLLPKSVSNAHKHHLLHLHDLGNFTMVYCVGWSVRDILKNGLRVDTRFPSSGPAQHFGVALEHILNHCFIHTNEASGAMAYSSVDVFLAPFIKEDKLTYKQVKQQTQRLIFALSQKYRTGLQSPFSNITLDMAPLGTMKYESVIVGGKELDYTYSDCQREIDMFNRAFCEVMSAGDFDGKPFSFPIPTYSITKDFDWYGKTAKMLFKMASETGIPYFSNFVNSDMDPDDVRSMCPLTADTEVLVRTSKGIQNKTILSIIETMRKYGTEYEVFYKGEWSKAEPVRVPMTKVLKITLSNGDVVRVGENHLQPVLGKGTLKASELSTGMFLPYNKHPVGSDLGSFSLGYAVGAFAGDGRLGTNPNFRVDYPSRERYGALYDTDDDFNYYSIVTIEEVSALGQELYCFEVNNQDHCFTLSSGLVTHNCRLRLDKRELVNAGGGLFGAGEKTGSMGVVTLNLPRLAFMAANPKNWQVRKVMWTMNWRTRRSFYKLKTKEERLYFLIDYTMEQAKTSLVIKRSLVEENLQKGLFPYTKVSLDNYSDHFNTIGIVGMNEALLNFGFKDGILTDGKLLAENVLDFILERLKDYQEEYGEFYEIGGKTKGLLWNFEATPSEGSGYKLAKYDHEYFKGKLITSNGISGSDPYYTNSTWVGADESINDNLFDLLDHQDSLQEKYTSGTVLHIYTKGKLTWEKGRDIIMKACKNYHLPYISLSPTITVCPVHGRLDDEYEFCPYDHTEEELEYIKKMGGVVTCVPSEGDTHG
jgi:anaerobic ribonucleoside-triphosphate reductase